MEQIPKIINKSKTKYNKIFNIEVLESNGYESKKKILKEIQIKDDSTVIKLNNIFSEAMINRFSNENLNNSEHMYINNNKLNLILDKADGTCFNVKNVSLKRLEYWLFTISKSIMELHKKRIIHGDIKSSNILIFKKEIKLADFEMSSFILKGEDQKFSKKIYTHTHRAPEVWNTDTWGFSADIWALGCTFVEILYNQNICQKFETVDSYLEFYKTWNPRYFIEKNSIDKYKKYNEILINMLNLNPLLRMDIYTICDELYNIYQEKNIYSSPSSFVFTNIKFSYLKRDLHDYYTIKNNKIKDNIISLTYCNDITYINLISSLYENCVDINDNFNYLTIKACAIIINFIVFNNELPYILYTNDDIIEIIRISKKVDYHFINWVQMFRII